MNAQVIPFPSYAPRPEPGSGPTVAEIVKVYLDLDTRLSPAARVKREYELDALVTDLGERRLSECRPSDLEHWLAKMATRWPSASKRKTACSGVQRAFNWAVRDRRLSENPFRGVTVEEEEETGRAMTDREFDTIYAASSLPFRRVLRFLDLTGCRPCELCALEWPMIDVDRRIAILKKHKTAKKTKRPRVLYLIPECLEMIANILAEQEQVGLVGERVFLNSRGSPWTKANLSNRMQDLRPKTGIPVDCVLYGIRHRYATRAALQGTPIKLLAELLGHASTRTTERFYTHLGAQHEAMGRAAIAAVGRLGE